jgi:hypothetical protein
MKSITKIIYVFTLIFISLSVTSCLNDEMIDSQEYGLINLDANKIIEIPSDASHEISLTLLPEGEKQITIGEVRLAAENPASEDIVVSLTSDTAGVFSHGEGIFPLDKVQVPATVTIPKGERSAPLVITVNTAFLQSSPTYIAVTVKSVDKAGYIISGNYGTVKINAKVKHKYEGRYVLTGSFTNLVAANFFHITTLEPVYTVQLLTKDGATLKFFDEMVWEGYTYPMSNNGAYSGFGSFCPMFTFDANNNVTAVTNYYAAPANTRACELDPSGVNKYDPVTKSFTVSYWMNQSSVVAAPPHHRIRFVETYTFKEDL